MGGTLSLVPKERVPPTPPSERKAMFGLFEFGLFEFGLFEFGLFEFGLFEVCVDCLCHVGGSSWSIAGFAVCTSSLPRWGAIWVIVGIANACGAARRMCSIAAPSLSHACVCRQA